MYETIPRSIFTADHDVFRKAMKDFCDREIVPNVDAWDEAGIIPRDFWLKAGDAGYLGLQVDPQYGGAGITDWRYAAIQQEEFAWSECSGNGIPLHNDIVLPYLVKLATDEQKARWFPKVVTGETILAIAMTEPGAGSDLVSMQTTARRDGDGWVLNGSKTFITNGINADLVVVAAITDRQAGHAGMSLFAVERGMEGFERGRKLEKLGMPSQDTAELFFTDVRLDADQLIGEEGKGFYYLMDNLAEERLAIAVMGLAGAERAFTRTMDYVTEREAFGRPIAKFQNTRFEMATMSTELTVARAFVDRCIELVAEGALDAPTAAKAKWWVTELQVKVVDRCLQMHGGYGYMLEYPISKHYRDARVQTIYGGTTEIMKELIGRTMGL